MSILKSDDGIYWYFAIPNRDGSTLGLFLFSTQILKIYNLNSAVTKHQHGSQPLPPPFYDSGGVIA